MSELYQYELVDNCQIVHTIQDQTLTNVMETLSKHYGKEFICTIERYRMAVVVSKDRQICFGVFWQKVTT